MATKETGKNPSYYVRKRLFSNKPAVFGIIIIVIAHLIALLGYLIMPDSTPNADDGALQLRKKTPGFSATILKVRKDVALEPVSFIWAVYNGRDSEYTIVPLKNMPRIENDTVYYEPYDENTVAKISLIDCVKDLSVEPGDLLGGSVPVNAVKEKNIYKYVNARNEVMTVTSEELKKEFEENQIETRYYVLGTDKAGRDLLSRLLFGTRISLSIGFISVLISISLGVILGSVAGYFGGKFDDFIMWSMTVIWSIPTVMLVIAISLVLQSKGIWVAFVAVGLTTWVEVARVIRGQILAIKQKPYIEAAKAFGYSNFRIVFSDILPNVIGPLIVISTSNFASAILVEAGLSFLGLGVQPPTPSWGIMINDGFHAIGTDDSWHLVFFPSMCIFLMVLAFNLFGNGLRDAYDPQGQLKN